MIDSGPSRRKDEGRSMPSRSAGWRLAPLAVIAGLRGLCMGVSQPLMLSVLAEASGEGSLSRGAAVRTTANRVASASTPIAMGWIAGGFGLASSFYITGAVLAAGMCLVALRTRQVEARAAAR